jgi:hypothetical protein
LLNTSVSAWSLLQKELGVAHDRPAGSVTPYELADELGVSYGRASQILRAKTELKPVKYRLNGRQAVCFVVKQ